MKEPTRASLLDPSKMLLVAGAERLLAARGPENALRLVDEALLVGTPGPRPYPDADVHRVRSLALEGVPGTPPAEVALAALQSAKH